MTDDLGRFREQISDLDRQILAAVNRRVQLVAELKRYKQEHGLDFLDPDRERTMLVELQRDNSGPLSDDGVRELLHAVLDLTKREVDR